MSQASRKNTDATSSGHGALGMGGQPSDDPRDLNSGGGKGPIDDDLGGGTGPIPGATGKDHGNTAAGSVAGVKGDNAVAKDITKNQGS